MKRFDEKLTRIQAGSQSRSDFIIADAKDVDMGPGLATSGSVYDANGEWLRYRTREDFLGHVRAIVEQDLVDIMLLSASNLERLNNEGLFDDHPIQPAIRANESTDIWRVRGGTYHQEPSRPFRTADLRQVMYATHEPTVDSPMVGSDLGLYSVTFNNDLEADLATLEAFAEFRADAQALGFRYFLEVFNPNIECGVDPAVLPHYVNDCILRCLAGLTQAERPCFLKVAYNGPRALEELASFDPGLVVGVLGGGASTARDTFELLDQAQRYGARVALFGRKINLAESPLAIVRLMRAVADGDLDPAEAVRAYHDALGKEGVTARRSLDDDLVITEEALQ